MRTRTSVGLGLFAVALLIALSCTGPSSTSPDREDRSRVYHVQLDMMEDKARADRTLGRALEWWQRRSDVPRPLTGSDDSPVRVVWRAPLYRIRIGPFASRAQADSVLQRARSTFPDAFVSPDRLSSRSQVPGNSQ